MFLAQGKYGWLFRGQREPYPLLPSAWRPDALSQGFSGDPVESYMDQIHVEFDIACRFFEMADKRGLPLPEDSQSLRQAVRFRQLEDAARWPGGPMLSILALAQHYGLPTRLLDWTWNPYVAAYFAAEEWHREPSEKPLAVFALEPLACDLRKLKQELGTGP